MTMPTQPFGPDSDPRQPHRPRDAWAWPGRGTPPKSAPRMCARPSRPFEAALDAGITFFDHADIYGGTACESIFKDCLAAVPGSRERIFIATKVGIRAGYYDHSPDHIRTEHSRAR